MQYFLSNATPEYARGKILAGLIKHNANFVTGSEWLPLSVLITDDDNEIIGGLCGHTWMSWLYVEFFYVPEEFRGQNTGTKILALAEAGAKSRGCVGSYLNTFSFQAPEFYKKQGYQEFGRIDEWHNGHSRLFMKKKF